MAFTEQGVAMLSSVLNSERAIQVNIEIMRAFVHLRRFIATNRNLARRLDRLEKKYDVQFKTVFDAIRQLMAPSEPRPKRIGFRVEEKGPPYRVRRLRRAPSRWWGLTEKGFGRGRKVESERRERRGQARGANR